MLENVYPRDRPRIVLMVIPAALSYLGYLVGHYAFSIIRNTDDWWAPFLVFLNLRRRADVHMKNGKRFALTRSNFTEFISEIESIGGLRRLRGHKIGRDGRSVSFRHGKRLVRADLRSVESVGIAFHSRIFPMMDVKRKDVVDIGGFVGDSALYYLLAGGAKRVYVFEPERELCGIILRNIRLNGLEGRILLQRAAVSDRDSTGVKVADGFNRGTGKVGSVTLDSIVAKYGIDKAALKVDIEGGEYQVFRGVSGRTLRRFDRIDVEYHYGYRDILERLKEDGYRTRLLGPKVAFTHMFRSMTISGDIIASR